MDTFNQQKIVKYMMKSNLNYLNMMNIMNIVCIQYHFALNTFSKIRKESWIVDISASSHMSGKSTLFDSFMI